MKKFISSAIIGMILGTAFVVGLAHAEPRFRATSDALWPAGTSVVQVMEAYSTEGVGIPIDPDFLANGGSWQIVVNGAAPVYDLSIDGSLISNTGPYVPLSSMDQDSLTLKHWTEKAVPYSQAIINNISGGGSFDLYIIKKGN